MLQWLQLPWQHVAWLNTWLLQLKLEPVSLQCPHVLSSIFPLWLSLKYRYGRSHESKLEFSSLGSTLEVVRYIRSSCIKLKKYVKLIRRSMIRSIQVRSSCFFNFEIRWLLVRWANRTWDLSSNDPNSFFLVFLSPSFYFILIAEHMHNKNRYYHWQYHMIAEKETNHNLITNLQDLRGETSIYRVGKWFQTITSEMALNITILTVTVSPITSLPVSRTKFGNISRIGENTCFTFKFLTHGICHHVTIGKCGRNGSNFLEAIWLQKNLEYVHNIEYNNVSKIGYFNCQWTKGRSNV